MRVSLTLAAIAAVATAQGSSLTTASNGDVVVDVTRRQQVNIAGLQDSVSTLTEMVQSMATSMAEGTTAAMVNLQQEHVSRAIQNAADLASLGAGLSNVQSTVAAQEATIERQLSAAALTTTSTLTAALARIDADQVEASTAMSRSAAELEASISATASNLTASVTRVTNGVGAQLSTVTAAVANKQDLRKKMWVGGCSRHPGSGWQWYCLDRTAFTSDINGYFRKDNDRGYAQRTGLFRVTWWTIKQASGWAHHVLYRQGQSIHYGYFHVQHCWWKDQHLDHTMKVSNGQNWQLRSYVNCGHSYHHGGASQGGSGHHSQATFTYVGTFE